MASFCIPYGEERMPEGLLYQVDPESVVPVLEALLPGNAYFRYCFPL